METVHSLRRNTEQLHAAIVGKPKISQESNEAKPWISLFSSLYLAELAASEQASLAVPYFAAQGKDHIANFYRSMATEEREHAVLVRGLFDYFIEPPELAYMIYGGERCLTKGDVATIERLALVHLVFEPSALAFLSHIYTIAPQIFTEDWAEVIQSVCRQILADEASHVREGRRILAPLLSTLTDTDQQLIQKSVKTHHAFLLGGIRRFFQGTPHFSPIAQALSERYSFAFANTTSGILIGDRDDTQN